MLIFVPAITLTLKLNIMEIQLSVLIIISNVVWFFVYKNQKAKQIQILKDHNESLLSHKKYLEESLERSEQMTKSLNETVKLVVDNMKM